MSQFELFGSPQESAPPESPTTNVCRFLSNDSSSFVVDLDRPIDAKYPSEVLFRIQEFIKPGVEYLALSGMHKEIRRGSVSEALMWARILVLRGIDPREYLRKILLEETRNLSLVKAWKRMPSRKGFVYPEWDMWCAQLASSIKKWELPSRKGLFQKWVLASKRAFERLDTVNGSTEALHDSSDISELYEAVWSYRFQCKFRESVRILYSRVRDYPELRGIEDSLLIRLHGSYSGAVLAELLTGHLTDQSSRCDRTITFSTDSVPTVPAYRTYLYDLHTSKGKALYAEHIRSIRPGVALPEGIDLRWSGMLRGVCWRELACQSGKSLDSSWEEISIPEDVWNATCFLDGYYYTFFYIKSGLPTVFVPKRFRQALQLGERFT